MPVAAMSAAAKESMMLVALGLVLAATASGTQPVLKLSYRFTFTDRYVPDMHMVMQKQIHYDDMLAKGKLSQHDHDDILAQISRPKTTEESGTVEFLIYPKATVILRSTANSRKAYLQDGVQTVAIGRNGTRSVLLTPGTNLILGSNADYPLLPGYMGSDLLQGPTGHVEGQMVGTPSTMPPDYIRAKVVRDESGNIIFCNIGSKPDGTPLERWVFSTYHTVNGRAIPSHIRFENHFESPGHPRVVLDAVQLPTPPTDTVHDVESALAWVQDGKGAKQFDVMDLRENPWRQATFVLGQGPFDQQVKKTSTALATQSR